MTSIDEVPLKVWEGLWEKWVGINDPHDDSTWKHCTMCDWQNSHDGCGCCPIGALCNTLVMEVRTEDDMVEWEKALVDFKALIQEEIKKRK